MFFSSDLTFLLILHVKKVLDNKNNSVIINYKNKEVFCMSLKKYCEENNLDINKVFSLVVGNGGNILPCPSAYTGYVAVITEKSLICKNDKLNVCKEIPFSAFKRAEFGIGSGNLWLQCVVNDSELVFCSPRKSWKSPSGKLLMDKISEYTELLDIKEYERYTGKLFWIYMFK